jgi:uncharacterized protein YegP (UPF0339 family)
MLKKLVSVLALTGLAFGSGLCFNPYNHDYGVGLKGWGFNWGNKTIILHNGKMYLSKQSGVESIKLVKYIAKNNKALVLMNAKVPSVDGEQVYFIVYTDCINKKPVTKDLEVLGDPGTQNGAVNIPRYPIKFGFYKDGFWVKYLYMVFQNGWLNHPGGERCDYETDYFPYKLVKEHKGYDGPSKYQKLPNGLCNALRHEVGM